MTDIALECACGKVKGTLRGASPSSGTRLLCYCGDCQAYGRFLGRDDILDPWGGISVFQAAPAHVTISDDAGALAGMRLSEKGLYRWYCAECKTPVGNSMTPSVHRPTSRGSWPTACAIPNPCTSRFLAIWWLSRAGRWFANQSR